jgi:ParB-like chromosome segregation protein Spo0J
MAGIPDVLDPWREVIHPAALVLPRPTESEYAELKTSIEQRGLLTPLTTFVDAQGEHWLLDGVSRLQALVELNHQILNEDNTWAVKTTPYYEEEGADPYEIALSLNVIRRHLTAEQRKEVVHTLRVERPGLTDRAVARLSGASTATVAAVRRQMEEEDSDSSNEAGSEEGGEPAVAVEARPAERIEESGKLARGRKPAVSRPRIVVDADEDDEPFDGKTLPSASLRSRVAEVRRCMNHLRVTIEDLQSRR